MFIMKNVYQLKTKNWEWKLGQSLMGLDGVNVKNTWQPPATAMLLVHKDAAQTEQNKNMSII